MPAFSMPIDLESPTPSSCSGSNSRPWTPLSSRLQQPTLQNIMLMQRTAAAPPSATAAAKKATMAGSLGKYAFSGISSGASSARPSARSTAEPSSVQASLSGISSGGGISGSSSPKGLGCRLPLTPQSARAADQFPQPGSDWGQPPFDVSLAASASGSFDVPPGRGPPRRESGFLASAAGAASRQPMPGERSQARQKATPTAMQERNMVSVTSIVGGVPRVLAPPGCRLRSGSPDAAGQRESDDLAASGRVAYAGGTPPTYCLPGARGPAIDGGEDGLVDACGTPPSYCFPAGHEPLSKGACPAFVNDRDGPQRMQSRGAGQPLPAAEPAAHGSHASAAPVARAAAPSQRGHVSRQPSLAAPAAAAAPAASFSPQAQISRQQSSARVPLARHRSASCSTIPAAVPVLVQTAAAPTPVVGQTLQSSSSTARASPLLVRRQQTVGASPCQSRETSPMPPFRSASCATFPSSMPVTVQTSAAVTGVLGQAALQSPPSIARTSPVIVHRHHSVGPSPQHSRETSPGASLFAPRVGVAIRTAACPLRQAGLLPLHNWQPGSHVVARTSTCPSREASPPPLQHHWRAGGVLVRTSANPSREASPASSIGSGGGIIVMPAPKLPSREASPGPVPPHYAGATVVGACLPSGPVGRPLVPNGGVALRTSPCHSREASPRPFQAGSAVVAQPYHQGLVPHRCALSHRGAAARTSPSSSRGPSPSQPLFRGAGAPAAMAMATSSGGIAVHPSSSSSSRAASPPPGSATACGYVQQQRHPQGAPASQRVPSSHGQTRSPASYRPQIQGHGAASTLHLGRKAGSLNAPPPALSSGGSLTSRPSASSARVQGLRSAGAAPPKTQSRGRAQGSVSERASSAGSQPPTERAQPRVRQWVTAAVVSDGP
eukprot:TRINITY_DN41850_c1_g1_i1.p1 TRINITY_DN41850_c1_g1~~TRINITY_DN41850_c1_g1_i1.p1  ORF type:complete len:892 (+),score=93.47 TRINITY_DN41850_c1_g1_i1:71-2746(+)